MASIIQWIQNETKLLRISGCAFRQPGCGLFGRRSVQLGAAAGWNIAAASTASAAASSAAATAASTPFGCDADE